MGDLRYIIALNCVGCGTCASVCPQVAIQGTTAPYVIEEERCIHCGICVPICPVLAIKEKEESIRKEVR